MRRRRGRPPTYPLTHPLTHPTPALPLVFMSERSNIPDGETGHKKAMGPSSVVSTIGKIGMAITDECKDVGMAIADFFFFLSFRFFFSFIIVVRLVTASNFVHCHSHCR